MKPVNRRQFLLRSVAFTSVMSLSGLRPPRLLGAETEFKFDPSQPLIQAPADPAHWAEFGRRLAAWRRLQRSELKYSDSLYQRSDFAWVPSSFACCFLMLCDESFYDPKRGRYTVKEFLSTAAKEFGGFDSVVLWHAYPRIGFDDRNQFDFYRDAPGGLKGLRDAVRQLHREGVKVYIDYNPWDTGTHREPLSDLDELAQMVGALEADGIFLDTLDRGSEEFRAKLDAVRPGVVLEGEDALPLERVRDHHMSWAQWFNDSPAPGVLRNKWFERRHMQHQIQRWDRDHTAELHSAWMNGSGMMIWENVFGTWNGWSARDRSILRTILPIQRRYSDLFAGEGWTPLVPTLMPDVYANRWQGRDLRLWTLVNRSNAAREGILLPIDWITGEQAFDLVLGTEVSPLLLSRPPSGLFGKLGPRGVGCMIAGSEKALGHDFARFLARQRATAAAASGDATWLALHTTVRPPNPCGAKRGAVPEMANIPGATLRLKTEFRIRECGFYDSSHENFAQKFPPLHRPITFERDVTLAPFAIDLTLVTNSEFARFLKGSGYRPRHRMNFLKHWQGGAPPAGREDHPVVYVDLQDARAYAKWVGKRLPTEEEWQYGAQGPDGRDFPWGQRMQPDRCNAGRTASTTPVRSFPDGRSPFGLFDMCGNVWQWTESERSDGRTRFCILRGGSFYHARGSVWYADGGPQPCGFAAKFLLTWPGLDRCATIGFRCAA